MKEEIAPAIQPQSSAQIETPTADQLQGFGQCSSPGCGCQTFVQNPGSNLCGNCEHRYEMHW